MCVWRRGKRKWKLFGEEEHQFLVCGRGRHGCLKKKKEEDEKKRKEKEEREKGKNNKKEYSSFYFGIFLFIFITLTLNSPIGLPQFDF